MKKSLVVLLIAVLVSGFAFADPAISGSVTATASFDLEDFTYSFENVNELVAEFKFEKTFTAAKAGSAMPYVDLAATLTLGVDPEGTNVKFDEDFELETFKVVGDGWNVDFLAKTGAIDYAKSAIDTKKVGDPSNVNAEKTKVPYTVTWGTKKNAVAYTNDELGTVKAYVTKVGAKNGLETSTKATQVWDDSIDDWVYPNQSKYTVISEGYASSDYAVKYISDENFGKIVFNDNKVATDGNIYQVLTSDTDGAWYKIYSAQKEGLLALTSPTAAYFEFNAEVESKEFEVTDALSAKLAAGAYYKYTNEPTTSKFGVSGQFAYDDVATFAFDFGGFDAYDVTTNLKLGFLDLSAYFASAATYAKPTVDGVKATVDDVAAPYLSAKAVATLEDLGTVVTVTGKDLFFGAYNVSVEAVNTVVDGYTFTAAGKNVLIPEKTTYSFGAKAEYEDDGLTLEANAAFALDLTPVFNFAAKYEMGDIKLNAKFAYDLGTSNEDLKLALNDASKTFVSSQFEFDVEFEADMFTATAAVYYNTLLDEDAGTLVAYNCLDEGWYLTAGISSDKLVDGATFAVDYTSGELFKGVELGTVDVTLKVSL